MTPKDKRATSVTFEETPDSGKPKHTLSIVAELYPPESMFLRVPIASGELATDGPTFEISMNATGGAIIVHVDKEVWWVISPRAILDAVLAERVKLQDVSDELQEMKDDFVVD